MSRVSCHYFCSAAGRLPVEEFILSLGLRTRVKFFYVRQLLEEFGHELPMPHAKYLKDKIFELRFSGSEGAIRVLYFLFEGKAVLTNGFVKKTPKTPESEIETAIRRRTEYLQAKS